MSWKAFKGEITSAIIHGRIGFRFEELEAVRGDWRLSRRRFVSPLERNDAGLITCVEQ